jgi:hypothetical protein
VLFVVIVGVSILLLFAWADVLQFSVVLSFSRLGVSVIRILAVVRGEDNLVRMISLVDFAASVTSQMQFPIMYACCWLCL